MTIESQSNAYVTVTADANESVDTEITFGYSKRKMFLSSFHGDGVLESSDDGETWIDKGLLENQGAEIEDTLQRYMRITGTGSKTLYFVMI